MLLRETRRRSSEQKCEKTCLGCASPKGTHRRDVLRVKRLAQCRPAIVEGVDLFERLVIYCLESGIVIQDGQGRRSSTSLKMHVPIFGVAQEHRSQEDGLLSENRMIVARNRSCEPFACRTTTAALRLFMTRIGLTRAGRSQKPPTLQEFGQLCCVLGFRFPGHLLRRSSTHYYPRQITARGIPFPHSPPDVSTFPLSGSSRHLKSTS